MADVRRIGLDEVARHFETLEDPRCSVNRKHPLVSVLVIALMAFLAGANGPTAIAEWAGLGGERGHTEYCMHALLYSILLPSGLEWGLGEDLST